MLMTSGDLPAKYEVIGMVWAEGRDNHTLMNTMSAERAINKATKELKIRAAKLSANAIINCHFAYASHKDAMNFMSVIAYGTAVRVLSRQNTNEEVKDSISDESGAAGIHADVVPERVDLVLKRVGEKKIAVIKEMMSILDLGLAEAKRLVESAPVTIIKDTDRANAEMIASGLELAGASVEQVNC